MNIEKISVNGIVYDLRDVEDIAAEKARAIAVENALSEAIATEEERATEAEGELKNSATSISEATTRVEQQTALKKDKFVADHVTDYTLTAGFFVAYNTGLLYTSTKNSLVEYFNCEGCDKLRYLCNIVSNTASTVGLAFYDADKKFISGEKCLSGDTDGIGVQIVTVPSNAVYAQTTILKEYASEWFCEKLIDNELRENTIHFSGKLHIGAYLPNTGELATGSAGLTSRMSNYIDVGDAKRMHINMGSTSLVAVLFYDSAMNFISRKQYNDATSVKFDIPENTGFIRLRVNVAETTREKNYDIAIVAKYYSDEPKEIYCEMPVTNGDTPNRVIFSFSFVKPYNAAIDVTSTDEYDAKLYSDTVRYGWGVVLLPTTYAAVGAPTRVVIYYPGSGAVGNPDVSASNQPFVDYLLAEGYAVAFMPNPWGCNSDFSWQSKDGVEFWGTPTNYAAAVAFYDNLMDRFNFKKEVFAYAKSQGAVQLSTLPFGTNIPYLACCSLSGELSALRNFWGYNDTERIAAMRDFSFDGMEEGVDGSIIGEANVMLYQQVGAPNYGRDNALTEDRKEFLLSQAGKLRGYLSGTVNNATMSVEQYIENYKTLGEVSWAELGGKLITNIPFLLYVAKDDSTMYGAAKKFLALLNNGNSYARLRTMPSGLENPHNAATSLAPKMIIATKYGGEMSIPITAAEMLQFFKRFEV